MARFIGVDLHKTQFTVHFRKENVFEEYPTTESGYYKMQNKIRNLRKSGDEVFIAVESTGNTRFFKNEMEKAGAKVVVINTLKFKIITQSAKKTDKHDAATISEFLEKDMLPESILCTRMSENIRRLLKSRERIVRLIVGQKNEAHALLVSIGMEDKKGSLQSKKGRQAVLDALESKADYVLEAQSVHLIFDIINKMEENIKMLETQLEAITAQDEVVARLKTIRGCGKITAWTIRAYTDDITRFKSAKKYAAFCGLVPWVQNSNETIYHGKITKRGPQELRTAYVQLVMGLRRCRDTGTWRLMQRYEHIKKNKGSGKSIIATARKLAEIVWTILSRQEDFNAEKMQQKFPTVSYIENLDRISV